MIAIWHGFSPSFFGVIVHFAKGGQMADLRLSLVGLTDEAQQER